MKHYHVNLRVTGKPILQGKEGSSDNLPSKKQAIVIFTMNLNTKFVKKIMTIRA